MSSAYLQDRRSLMRTLVLWDIDGTLIRGGRIAMLAFNQALREVYELADEPRRIEYGGKTDGQIALEVLALHDIAEERAVERLSHFHDRYTGLLHSRIDELREGLTILPGVPAIFDAINETGAIQSVLTGNLRMTAMLKLQAAGLEEWLDLDSGAYGSDQRDRDALVPIACAKAAVRWGAIAAVVVVGDTPRDIACGKAGGARTVAVATGNWSYAELALHTPDRVLADLSDIPAAVDAILDR